MAIITGTLTLKYAIGIGGGGWMIVCADCHDGSIAAGETTAGDYAGSGFSSRACGACGS